MIHRWESLEGPGHLYLSGVGAREAVQKNDFFSFLAGNEDMHLKNFSLTSIAEKTELSPAYDLLNSTLALAGAAKEEVALPIRGKNQS
jgi:serine/threonine-protein kinase HipA